MIDGVNLHMLPHLSGVPHLHVNRGPQPSLLIFGNVLASIRQLC